MCDIVHMTNEKNDESAASTSEDEGPFETVWRGYDAAEGQMLEEMLRQEGFTARLIGTRTAALIGVGQFTAELRLEVPSESAKEVAAVLEEFVNADIVAEDSASEDERE